MKTNLDAFFKADKNLELQGVRMEVAPGVAFFVRRFGGANAVNVSKALAKFHKPHAKKLELGNVPAEFAAKIDAQVFVEACVTGWEGVSDSEGKELTYSFEACVDMLVEMPDLFNALFKHASMFETYKEEVGNS
jgi:hypothetical protein